MSTLELEKELIQSCLQGDQTAWHKLYLEHRREAWAALYRLLGPREDLEDLVQTAFMKVHKNLSRFEGRSRFSTWLYRICVHVGVDHIRKLKRRREYEDSDKIEATMAPDCDPSQTLEQKQMRQKLQKALSKMKEKKRNVLILHDLMEVSCQEIAEDMKLPAATVRTRLFYARRDLARIMAKQEAGGGS